MNRGIKLGKTEFGGILYFQKDGTRQFVPSVPGELKDSIEKYLNQTEDETDNN